MRAWLEIDMDNLKYNLNKIKELVHGTNVLGVIKANSYGFGAIEIAKELSKFGIEIFGVASLEEAMELREGGIEEEILILGSLFNDEIEIAAEKKFQITVSSMRQIEFLESNKIDAEIHIKIDTGMGRLGFTPSEGRKAVDYCINRGLKVVGIYSHLSDADGMNDEAYNYTKEQINKFKIFEEYKTIKYIHILNIVRAGICMYGMLGNERVPGFKRVFTMKTRILFIRTLEEDSYISYGRTIKLKKGETFATLAIGYADGMKKEFSNKTYALIEGEKCPIVGEICMDMCMVKIPESILKKINIGTEAIVIRDDIIEEINSIHKSTWDILTGIGRRVYRVYKKNGTPYLITR